MSGSISATTLATIAVATSVAGAGVGAYGAIKQGEATSNAEKYNAQVATNNAAIAEQSAQRAGAAGNAQAEQASLKTRATVGAIKANQAASGVDVNSGSSLDVRSSAQELGELNAINVRSNAANAAYGYKVQAASYSGQSTLDQYAASTATSAADISAGGTVLSGIGGASSNYSKFLQQGSLSTGS